MRSKLATNDRQESGRMKSSRLAHGQVKWMDNPAMALVARTAQFHKEVTYDKTKKLTDG
jgi:hypothetical protein